MNFQNNFQPGANHQYTPEFLNQWSTNQELIYRNVPHDKVDWSSLAREWIEMQQNAMTNQSQNVLFNEMQFLANQPNHQLNQVLMQRPMHLANFNLPPPPLIQNHQFNSIPNHFHPHVLQPPNQLHLTSQQLNSPFNEPFNHQINHFNHHQQFNQPPQLMPTQPNFYHQKSQIQQRKDPPLLPPFEQPAINQLNNQTNHFNRNDAIERNASENLMHDDDFKRKNSDPCHKVDLDNGSKIDNHSIRAAKGIDFRAHNNAPMPINHQMQFNQQTTNMKVNHQITNQLDQETVSSDVTNSDANKQRKKLLPDWISSGLERMEREKQKKIEKEESMLAKAKEEQIRKELDDEDEKDEELKERDVRVEEKRKLFSGGIGGLHQKTFADMFLVKKGKNYYYENEEAREKELMIRTKKVLTNILIEVTDSMVRQVASKCLQEAKIQKIAALSKQLAKPQPMSSSGLGGIVSQYYSDSDDSSDEDTKTSKGKLIEKKDNDMKSKEGSTRRRSKERRSRSRDRSRSRERKSNNSKRRSRSKERRSRSKDRKSRDHRRRSKSNERKKSLSRDSKSSNNSKRDKFKRRSRSKERRSRSKDQNKISLSRNSSRRSRSKDRRKRSCSKDKSSNKRHRSRSRKR